MTAQAGCWINYTGNRPTKQHRSDAGFDMVANESVKVKKGGCKSVSLGTAIAIPSSHFGMLVHRSSLAFKKGVVASTGIIDSGYRGEIKVLLFNHSEKDVWIDKGDRICQLLVIPLRSAIFQEGVLDDSDRGNGGFGSTGDV